MSRNRYYAMNPYPHNPFQGGKGRSMLPRYNTAPQRGMPKALKQACVVLTVGAILVTALSWAVPPAPGDIKSMSAPRPLQQASAGGVRMGGGVRSQSTRARSVKKPEDSRHTSQHHWDADTLEQPNHGNLVDYDGGSSDESPRSTSKKKLAANIESKTEEENAHAAKGVFGRKQDGQDHVAATESGDAVVQEDAPVSEGEGNKHAASKGHVTVEALDAEDAESKAAESKTANREPKPFSPDDGQAAESGSKSDEDVDAHESSADKKDSGDEKQKVDATGEAMDLSKTEGEGKDVAGDEDGLGEKGTRDEQDKTGDASGEAAVPKRVGETHDGSEDQDRDEKVTIKTDESSDKEQVGGDKDGSKDGNDARESGSDGHSDADAQEAEQSNKNDAIAHEKAIIDPTRDESRPDDQIIGSENDGKGTSEDRGKHEVALELDGDIEADVA